MQKRSQQVLKSLFPIFMLLLSANIAVGQNSEKAAARLEKAKTKTLEQMTKQKMKMLEKVSLTEEQQAGAKVILAKHVEKMLEAKKALRESVPKEKMDAYKAAFKTAKEDGAKYAAAAKQAIEESGMSEEEVTAFNAATESLKTVNTAINEEIMATLTEEQREMVQKKGSGAKGGKGKKGKGKKGKKNAGASEGDDADDAEEMEAGNE